MLMNVKLPVRLVHVVARLFILTSKLAPAAAIAATDDLCKSLGKSGELTMRSRQQGVDMSAVMELANKAGPMKQVLRHMIIDAYDEPQYSSKEMQDRVIKEFSNQAQLKCYKNL
jgi:hypothetical protein